MEKYDVAIVGASAIGSRVANLISREGYRVLLIEEHREVGLPMKCTGLVSFRLLELLPNLPKKVIVNKIRSAKFFSPNGNCLELKPSYPVYVIDRVALDKFLFDQVKNNVEVRIPERFESFRCMEDSIKIRTNKRTYYSKILVGADGVNSTIRKQAKIVYPKNFLIGLQTTAKGSFDPSSVELWFGSQVCPKFFAWVVPENENTARIGLATNSNPMKYYKQFLKLRINSFKKPDVGGLIRYGLMKETCRDRVMLIGDAALQIKPFSGGGLVYGLTASKICADACVHALENERFDENFFKENYDKKWKEKLAIPIIEGLMLRKSFNLLPDVSLNLAFYSTHRIKKFLEKWDMDLL